MMSCLAITFAVQRLRDMCVCPDPAHLFVDVLTKVGYVEDPTVPNDYSIPVKNVK